MKLFKKGLALLISAAMVMGSFAVYADEPEVEVPEIEEIEIEDNFEEQAEEYEIMPEIEDYIFEDGEVYQLEPEECWADAYMAAAGIDTVDIQVQYGQTEARSMLAMINDFRTGDEAYFNNETDTETVYQTGLIEYSYDYTLEAVAMQRAAEIAACWSHTRPNGENCWSARPTETWYRIGENIAVGQTSAQAAFTSWKEDNKPYSGQGHRRNMLSSDFTAIGIGHAYVNGVHFWVQEFRNPVNNTTDPGVVDYQEIVPVEIKTADVSSSATAVPSVDKIELEVDENAEIPTVSGGFRLTSTYTRLSGMIPYSKSDVVWTSSNTGVVYISPYDGVRAVGAGEATLSATVLGKYIEIPVTVTRSADYKLYYGWIENAAGPGDWDPSMPEGGMDPNPGMDFTMCSAEFNNGVALVYAEPNANFDAIRVFENSIGPAGMPEGANSFFDENTWVPSEYVDFSTYMGSVGLELYSEGNDISPGNIAGKQFTFMLETYYGEPSRLSWIGPSVYNYNKQINIGTPAEIDERTNYNRYDVFEVSPSETAEYKVVLRAATGKCQENVEVYDVNSKMIPCTKNENGSVTEYNLGELVAGEKYTVAVIGFSNYGNDTISVEKVQQAPETPEVPEDTEIKVTESTDDNGNKTVTVDTTGYGYGENSTISLDQLKAYAKGENEESVNKVELVVGMGATSDVGSSAPVTNTKIVDETGAVVFEANALGGQFRYDKKAEGKTYAEIIKEDPTISVYDAQSKAIDYADLRLQYNFSVPEGAENVQWHWMVSYLTKAPYVVNGQNAIITEGNGVKNYVSNVVLTNIPVKYSDLKLTALLTVSYELDGVSYTFTQSENTPLGRTFETLADSYVSSEAGYDYICKLKEEIAKAKA